MKWNELENESCPIAKGLSIVGDRWTMLILRDCFLGVRRFDDFQSSIGMTRHVLSDRLKKLCEADVLKKEAYQDRPKRYEYRLTERGKSFFPILMSLIGWVQSEFPEEGTPPYEFLLKDSETRILPELKDAHTGQTLELGNIIRRVNEAS